MIDRRIARTSGPIRSYRVKSDENWNFRCTTHCHHAREVRELSSFTRSLKSVGHSVSAIVIRNMALTGCSRPPIARMLSVATGPSKIARAAADANRRNCTLTDASFAPTSRRHCRGPVQSCDLPRRDEHGLCLCGPSHHNRARPRNHRIQVTVTRHQGDVPIEVPQGRPAGLGFSSKDTEVHRPVVCDGRQPRRPSSATEGQSIGSRMPNRRIRPEPQ